MARTTFSGPVVSQNGFIDGHQVTAANAINTTATATAAQVASGYITSTSVGTGRCTVILSVTSFVKATLKLSPI